MCLRALLRYYQEWGERRFLVIAELFCLLIGACFSWLVPDLWVVGCAIAVSGMVVVWLIAYLFQELVEDELAQYTIMISDISVIRAKLNRLVSFLELERERVLRSEV